MNKHVRALMIRSSLLLCGLVWMGCGLLGCEPPDPPELGNPPCVSGGVTPQQDSTIKREKPSFQVTFSKLMEPSTINEETIYLVRDEMDISFLRNLESTSPVTESRLPRLVALDIKSEEVDGKTQLTITPRITLRGDSLYQLVLTRRLRDKLVELSENRRTGSRPLNRCADADGVWKGSVDEYRDGQSLVLDYNTEPEPPRPGEPRIVEVMASPPTGGAEYVEIQNVSKTEELDLCGLILSDGGTPREIADFKGAETCKKVPPGGRAVIIEPDYDLTGNPYGIPATAVVLTTVGSSTTLLSGGITSGEPVQLLQGEDLLEQVSPSSVSGGVWPSGKSLEKCSASGPNDGTNWAESGEASGGTAGKQNTATCN